LTSQAIGQDSLVGQTLGHYRISEKIGAGGMGEVYRARDEHLDREVAIKVLPSGTLSDESSRRSFRKEALALSKLNHPNIATIYDFDTQQGVDFLVMEYIPGITLRERLGTHALPEKEILRLGTQLAEGLGAAHDHGVIHRDLKPENLRLTPEGRLKILDFGLARTLHGVTTTPTAITESLTETKAIAGTLPYMAPEQLHGRPADSRTDIWALGVVLYEMATGAVPFPGKTGFEVSSAILNERPAPAHSRVPLNIATVIERCLEKEPEQRYQNAGEVKAAIEAVRPDAAANWRTWHGWLPLAAAVVLIAGLIVTLNLVGLRNRLWGEAPEIHSLAVLPLTNLSGETSQDYFADGMTETLITNLSRIRALKVISRTSVMRYKGAKKPLPEIARELGVDGIVEGSVQLSEGRVLITAQLIRAATDTHLWAESYERDLQDVLHLQAAVAQAIAREIQVVVTPQEQLLLAKARRVNPEAYEAYLNGRFHYYKLSREELNTAEAYFELALQKDPDYALAYAGLASVWLSRGDTGLIPPSEALTKTKAAALKALELDASLPEAHVSLGNVRFIYEWDWSGAEKEYRRALELDPNSASAHFSLADLMISIKRSEEWKSEMERDLELDPFSFFPQCFYGWHLVYVGRYDEAIVQLRKVLAEQPDFSSVHLGLWGAFYKKGMYDEALAEASKFYTVIGQTDVAAVLASGHGKAGYTEAMRRAADRMVARSKLGHVPATRVARLYAHAGDKDHAMTWLEKAYEQGEPALDHVNVFWDWDSLRGEPRFQELIRRMKFPT
jgi:serine/threonine protein kinase/Tfp pilus assembly protein PilF